MNDDFSSPSSRRAFLHRGAVILASASGTSAAGRWLAALEEPAAKPVLSIGLLTDVHYADKTASGERAFRDSIGKMREAVKDLKGADFLIELGDLIDGADTIEEEKAYLGTIARELAGFQGERHHVLGNHCVWSLTKEELLAGVGARAARYSFDRGDFHFVILDSCFRADGAPYGRKNNDWTDASLPAAEQEWLKADLAATKLRSLVFIHHRLDVATSYAIREAAKVRGILAASGKVRAVFQGHNHVNDHHELDGIHYVTLTAMVEGKGVENGAHGILRLFADGSMRVEGYRRLEKRALPARAGDRK